MAPPSEPGAFAWGVSLPEEMHPSALVRDYRCGAVLGQGDPPHDAANRVGPCDGSVHTVHDLHLARPDDAHQSRVPSGLSSRSNAVPSSAMSPTRVPETRLQTCTESETSSSMYSSVPSGDTATP